MHPVKINEKELKTLKEAEKTRDLSMLYSWKLKYLYQRCVLLPEKDIKTLKLIANEAKRVLKEEREARDIFGA